VPKGQTGHWLINDVYRELLAICVDVVNLNEFMGYNCPSIESVPTFLSMMSTKCRVDVPESYNGPVNKAKVIESQYN
jgi:hypothetical protein